MGSRLPWAHPVTVGLYRPLGTDQIPSLSWGPIAIARGIHRVALLGLKGPSPRSGHPGPLRWRENSDWRANP
jgi:hypothetical protein